MKTKNLLIPGVLIAMFFLTLYSFKTPPAPFDRNKVQLGTVEASVLDYDHLTRINGDPLIINVTHSAWVPADGRSIAGSALAQQTGMQNAPDLRGRFVRGLNTIYNVGQPALNPGVADSDDPSSNRKPGDFQGDLIRANVHAFSHVIQEAP